MTEATVDEDIRVRHPDTSELVSGIVVLVHGSFHTGACWEPLAANLGTAGIETRAPTLPGQLGGPPLNAWRVSMNRYGEAIVAAAENLGGRVDLVAHSMGGLGASRAAELRPELFRRIIYLSAVVPRLGRYSMLDVGRRLGPELQRAPRIHRNGTITVKPEAARAAFYHRVPPERQEWAIERLSPQPLSTSWSSVHTTADRFGRIEKHYIGCSDDRALPPETQRAMQSHQEFASVHLIDSDHSPFLSATTELTTVLGRILSA
ncbi:MAG TPA: alpha/beta hydrolase [Pseudolysinimonas sp.]|nr:alpha/beta hydrolase [Pseudolysinimonas sp.]